MREPPHILVFDSGAGGLSVARAILAKIPSCRLTYAADNAAFPYGLLDDQTLINRVCQQIESLIFACNPDVIVIACNTASTIVLDHLREMSDIPFVGVVPAVKPAAQLTQTGVIGLLATPATVNRDYTLSLIKQFAAGTTVKLYGSNILVTMAEESVFGIPPKKDELAAELDLLLGQNEGDKIDTVVLACTHFPLLVKYLRELPRGRSIRWVDSGEAIARRVEYWIEELGFTPANSRTEGAGISIILSDPDNPTRNIPKAYQAFLTLEDLKPGTPNPANSAGFNQD